MYDRHSSGATLCGKFPSFEQGKVEFCSLAHIKKLGHFSLLVRQLIASNLSQQPAVLTPIITSASAFLDCWKPCWRNLVKRRWKCHPLKENPTTPLRLSGIHKPLRHAQFECHSLTIVWDITNLVQIKNVSSIAIRHSDREVVDLYTQDNANGLD